MPIAQRRGRSRRRRRACCSTTCSAAPARTRWAARRATSTGVRSVLVGVAANLLRQHRHTRPPGCRRHPPRRRLTDACAAPPQAVLRTGRMVELRHLGPFSGLAELAERRHGLFPEAAPGPALKEGRPRGHRDARPRRTRCGSSAPGRRGTSAARSSPWSVGFGPRTHAYLLKPRHAEGPLPGVLALHCHAGMKWAGKEKIADGPEPPTPEVLRLREQIYGGRGYASELARRGFAVLVPDVIGWGSRRIDRADMPERVLAQANDPGMSEADRYDVAAGHHEHVLEKYCTLLGTSLAGVVAGEDLAAAAYLRSRPDIGRIGCVGLSGGGLRAALLGASTPASPRSPSPRWSPPTARSWTATSPGTPGCSSLPDCRASATGRRWWPPARPNRSWSCMASGTSCSRRPGCARRTRPSRAATRTAARGGLLRRPARLRRPHAGARLHLARAPPRRLARPPRRRTGARRRRRPRRGGTARPRRPAACPQASAVPTPG